MVVHHQNSRNTTAWREHSHTLIRSLSCFDSCPGLTAHIRTGIRGDTHRTLATSILLQFRIPPQARKLSTFYKMSMCGHLLSAVHSRAARLPRPTLELRFGIMLGDL